MKFRIEQIAINPPDPEKAHKLLHAMGLTDWAMDTVVAKGVVFGAPGRNMAHLAFNYQAGQPSVTEVNAAALASEPDPRLKPLEFEVLSYAGGDNWLATSGREGTVSHLGMHCSPRALSHWREFFCARGIGIAQEVFTESHTNPVIAGKRWYQYVIFDTREILGVDVKFIVRLEKSGG